jgi:hypothetical protein
VLLGMGTAVASLLSAAPWLVSLSRAQGVDLQHRGSTHCSQRRDDLRDCAKAARWRSVPATDPAACAEASRLSRIFLWTSALIWSCGFFVAYLLGPLLEHFDR